MSGVEWDINVEIEIVFEGGSSDGPHPRIILFVDPTLRQFFMLKKDLNPESLRWCLLLQQFDFAVYDKG